MVYPFDTEVTVTTKDGKLEFVGDFTEEKKDAPKQDWERPFSAFAPNHFGFTSSLDIKTDPGYGTMILPHPRYYTDRIGTVPLVVGGMIESDFWPRVFFIVFKSPLEGQSYIFRKGEGYAQLLFVPKSVKYNINPMTPEESKERYDMEQILSDHPKSVSTNTWKTVSGDSFDNKYKVLSAIAKQSGASGVYDYLRDIKNEQSVNQELRKDNARRKFPRRLINANNIQRDRS